MERVMGIEPTLSAWEAEVLPLNYTRPCPKRRGRTATETGDNVSSPLGAISYRPALRRVTMWKSARFRVGAIVSAPIPCHYSMGVRFLHVPLPTASSDTLASTLVWLDRPDAALGLPRSA